MFGTSVESGFGFRKPEIKDTRRGINNDYYNNGGRTDSSSSNSDREDDIRFGGGLGMSRINKGGLSDMKSNNGLRGAAGLGLNRNESNMSG